jgi:hypothetical protein
MMIIMAKMGGLKKGGQFFLYKKGITVGWMGLQWWLWVGDGIRNECRDVFLLPVAPLP